MAEYLAPGVYVEETSFRAKSIEGVSTSTTAFVGITRKGPFRASGMAAGEERDGSTTPELLTSFADFERIYGGYGDIFGSPNYMAHSVKAYFDNGGARLYVSRVYTPGAGDGLSASPYLVGDAASPHARFVARFPGAIGDGKVSIQAVLAPATATTLARAPEGTLVVTGSGHAAARPARLTSSAKAPFNLTGQPNVRLVAGGTNIDLSFHATTAEAFAAAPLDATTNLGAVSQFRVNLGSGDQIVTLAAGAYSPADLLTAINRQLRGGYARLSTAADPGGTSGKLVIGSDKAGSQSSVTVGTFDAFHFAPTTVSAAPADNNVADLSAVTIAEINALLPATVSAGADASGHIVFRTTASGAAATLTSTGNPGFGSFTGADGADGSVVTYYLKKGTTFADSGGVLLDLGTVADDAAIVTLTVTAWDAEGAAATWDGLGVGDKHPRYIATVLSRTPTRRTDYLQNLIALDNAGLDAYKLSAALLAGGFSNTIQLTGGSDGVTPNEAAFENALLELEKLEDIAIVAAPGSSVLPDIQGIHQALLTHAEKLRAYRIAILDTPPKLALSEVRAMRGRFDSSYGALYWSWVIVSNPLARPNDDSQPKEIALPPSGFVAGVYARTDVARGVFKAPANEIVRGALRFETDINFAQQQVLNPLGVNCLRFLPNRGYRVWGARTASSDPEWKYINVRRYFNYLEHSIDNAMQWAVFEPNGPALWTNIRDTVSSFLEGEWRSGALLGDDAASAYFVRCDRSTMTQSDLDSGRLVCLVGVAVVKPAEFVIFRIGQKTADART